jgi:sarcosine oxidase / L-pipecolate oxidase
MPPPPQFPPPSILIIGSGVFGLSTALSLSRRPSFTSSTITLLDRSPFPSPDGSSIDTSRIIRADYKDSGYAALASAAQKFWRSQCDGELGGEGRYTESGLVLVADSGQQGEKYVRGSLENVKSLLKEEPEGTIRELKSRKEIEEAVGTGGGSGDWGYINTRSGWADAEEGMKWLRRQVESTNRITFKTGEAISLLRAGTKITGVRLKDNKTLTADLVILATGAWTGKLVDLRGRATATGQVLCYLDITEEEQERFGKMPVLLNLSTGMFIIPPRNRILKVARHDYGYSNPISIPDPKNPDSGEKITVSLPRTAVDDPRLWVPREGEEACRRALREMVPELGERPLAKTKICWYSDTPNGDFLITYHPEYEGLFLATGGSGHGYKFLPVIGEKIVDCVECSCPEEFKKKWRWLRETFENVVTEDGSRGGRPGMVLDQEIRRGMKL